MTGTQTETPQERTVRLALLAGRLNLIAAAARQHVADHQHQGEPCGLCAALAAYDRGEEAL